MSDLFLGRGIKNSETGVDVPFIRVDAESDINLNVLDSAYPAIDFPWELVVGVPCSAHAQESGVRHGLGISCDTVVHLAAKVDILRFEGFKDALDESHALVGCSVLNEDLTHEKC